MELALKTQEGKIYDLTDKISGKLPKNLESGLVNVFAPHATGILFLGENEPGINADYQKLLGRLAPEGPEGEWQHDRIDSNAHAHLRSALMGASLTIPVRDGRLQLGTWQRILFMEADGDRERRFILTFVKGEQ